MLICLVLTLSLKLLSMKSVCSVQNNENVPNFLAKNVLYEELIAYHILMSTYEVAHILVSNIKCKQYKVSSKTTNVSNNKFKSLRFPFLHRSFYGEVLFELLQMQLLRNSHGNRTGKNAQAGILLRQI